MSEEKKNQISEEEMQSFESKIDEVSNILRLMNSMDKTEQQTGLIKADTFLGNDREYNDKLKMDDFLVRVKDDRTVINRSAFEDAPMEGPTTDKNVFMAEMERDAMRRTKERKQRNEVAQNLRLQGNLAFQHKLYDKAVTMYTKALDQVKDSPILYTNRALSYIRLGLFRRAIIDCDFVLQKLDEKSLRAWLCRAYGHHQLCELDEFANSIDEAKKANPKELAYIEKVVETIKATGALAVCDEPLTLETDSTDEK